jgi:hypothetical protein
VSKIKKITVIIGLVLLAGIIFMCLYSFPKEFHAEHQALKFVEGDPSSVETVTVKIKGTLYRPIFKQHSFEGNIEIGGYDFTKPNQAFMNLYISKKQNGVYWGSILYTKETSPPDIVGPISAVFNEDFNQVSLVPSDNLEKNEGNKHTFIVIVAKNYEEAVKLDSNLRDALRF